MDSLNVTELATSIAQRAMQEARAIVDRAFDNLTIISLPRPSAKEAWNSESPLTLTNGVTVRGRSRPLNARTIKAIQMLEAGARNKDVADKLKLSQAHVSHIRRKHLKAA